jgi:hypothetical protein
MLRALAPGLR